MKLTDWYPGHIKPVRKGVYQRQYPNMGEADRAEIKDLRWALEYIVRLTREPVAGEALAFTLIRETANRALRVNTNSQSIVEKGE